ncbi:MAG: hypothetical protein RHS_5400 [Robinsoniella sp. RHS]|nr:MAG: hypothetical protein RHS_5400 [Robinsoniella sp. RHS]
MPDVAALSELLLPVPHAASERTIAADNRTAAAFFFFIYNTPLSDLYL